MKGLPPCAWQEPVIIISFTGVKNVLKVLTDYISKKKTEVKTKIILHFTTPNVVIKGSNLQKVLLT